MKIRAAIIAVIGLLLVATQVRGQNDIVFQPHDPEAPPARVAGAIRGTSDALSMAVLAPGELAVTARAAPALYWFASATVTYPVELVLIEEGGEDPLVKVVLQPPLQAGIHRFEIPADQALAVGAAYQWSVAAIPDPLSRSNDVFSSALMTRVEQPQSGGFEDGVNRAVSEARAGLWYDAFATLSEAVDANNSKQARELRASLLEQGELTEVAQFERQQLQE